MTQMNFSRRQKHTYRHKEACGCQRGGRGMHGIESLRLADANYYIKMGPTTRSYCTTQGTIFNIL